jgi:hypothetical protein
MYNMNVNGLGMPLPDIYKLSPEEYYPDAWQYISADGMLPGLVQGHCPSCGVGGMDGLMAEWAGYGLTKEEAGGWFKKNWKWLAIGAGGVVAVGIILKVVL